MNAHKRIDSISTEARGKLRRFKAEITERDERLDSLLLGNTNFDDVIDNFMFKGGKGKERAFAKLQQMVPAKLEFVSNKPRCIVWSAPVCSTHILSKPTTMGEAQSAIVMEFIAVRFIHGRRGFAVDRGIWTLELSDHALGRMFQRNPEIDPFAALQQAHQSILAAADDSYKSRNAIVYVSAPGGLFSGNIIWGGLHTNAVDDPIMTKFIQEKYGEEYNQVLVYFRAKTYLHDDQLGPHQKPLRKGIHSFGQGLMLPYTLRSIHPTDEEPNYTVIPWVKR